VTKGFVVEGTAEKQYIYQEMPEYSYPTQLGKIHTNLNITTAAQSGINCINWLANFYPTITFSEYDLFILELGLNGGLDINDINTPGTNTYAYAQIVSGARTQNPNMIIALVRSQHFGTIWGPVIEALVSQYDCIYVDLHDTTYLNLDDPLTDTIFRNNFSLDTIVGDKWFKTNLHLKFPSTIALSPEIELERYTFINGKRETVNPPKKFFLFRWFQKKHTVVEVNVREMNPYVKNKTQRFIQIIE